MFSSTRRVCGRDVARHQRAGRGIEGHLPGNEQELPGAKGRRVGPDRPSARRARDDACLRLVMRSADCFTSGGFDDLVRPQTAGADADPLDAAVDHRPHGLKVRLEPPRAHVVRVAELPADDRASSRKSHNSWP